MARPWSRLGGWLRCWRGRLLPRRGPCVLRGYFDGSTTWERCLPACSKEYRTPRVSREWGFSQKLGRVIAIACARGFAVCRRLTRSSTTSVTRWYGGSNYMATLFLALTLLISFRKITGRFCVVPSILLAPRSLSHFTHGAKLLVGCFLATASPVCLSSTATSKHSWPWPNMSLPCSKTRSFTRKLRCKRPWRKRS